MFPKIHERSDYNRKWGWHLTINGQIVASLSYLGKDKTSEFWTEYRLLRISQNLPKNPSSWPENNVVLINRKHPEIIVTEYMAAKTASGTVLLRGEGKRTPFIARFRSIFRILPKNIRNERNKWHWA
jgi:hypothetical protein